MKKLITESLEKSYSYAEYRDFISSALENNPDKLELSEELLSYAKLNETRLNRLDKTIVISDDVSQKLQKLKGQYIWIVISESWCGDAAQSVPVLKKMADATNSIDLVVVFRDKNEEFMNQFLTNGGMAIPKLVIVDKQSLEVLGDWGPRPALGQQLVEDYKAKHGKFDEQAKTDLQLWYTKDKGKNVQKEVVDLMFQIDK